MEALCHKGNQCETKRKFSATKENVLKVETSLRLDSIGTCVSYHILDEVFLGDVMGYCKEGEELR